MSKIQNQKTMTFKPLCVCLHEGQYSVCREFDTLKSKIFDRVRSELFFLSNLFSIFVVYISKYRKYETFN